MGIRSSDEESAPANTIPLTEDDSVGDGTAWSHDEASWSGAGEDTPSTDGAWWPRPGDVIGNFVLEEALGKGAFATVFRGRHQVLDVPYALKIITRHQSPRARARTLREARIQARLNHPNVVAVRDVLERDDRVVVVLDLVAGPTLAAWLDTHDPDPFVGEAIFRGILAGVGAAHALGIVHRDLKPHNVLLEPGTLVPRVTDFGLARLDDGEGHTRTGSTMGTPAYMAPEQIADSKDVDARADVFSLGCILYELVCGQRAFQRASVASLFEAIRDGDYQPIETSRPDLDPRLADTIRAMLAVDREARLPGCDAVLEALGPPPAAVDAVDLAQPRAVSRRTTARPAPRVRVSGERTSTRTVRAEAGVEVLGLLGAGGTGSVYRGRYHHPSGFSREVVVKVLHDRDAPERALARLRDEARVLASLTDRAVVGVQPPQRLGGRWAIVMDYVDGASLAAVLSASSAPVPPLVVAEVGAELARVLHKALHLTGPDGELLELLHRDIKPGNVMVTPSGEIRLVDFGLASARLEHLEGEGAPTGGTPGFAAPEVYDGPGGPEADVYALGKTLQRLLVHGHHGSASLTPTPRGPLHAALGTVIDTMTRIAARERPTAAEVGARLTELVRAHGTSGMGLAEWAPAVVIDAMPVLGDDPDLPPGTWLAEDPMATLHSAVPHTRPGRGRLPYLAAGSGVVVVLATLAAWWGLSVPEPVLPEPGAYASVAWLGGGLHGVADAGPWRVSDQAGTRIAERLTRSGHPAGDTDNPLPRPMTWPTWERVTSRPAGPAQHLTLWDAGSPPLHATVQRHADHLEVRYESPSGHPAPSSNGVFIERVQLDVDGAPEQVRWLGPEGDPLRADDGTWGVAFTPSPTGIVRIVHLDADGQPTRNHDGVVTIALERDARGRVVTQHDLGYGDMAVIGPSGCASQRWTWDDQGFPATWACVGLDGQIAAPRGPVRASGRQAARRSMAAERLLTDVEDLEPSLTLSEVVDEAVQLPHPPVPSLDCPQLAIVHGEGTRTTLCLDAEGAALVSRAGWARRVEVLDARGYPVEVRLESAAGERVANGRGVHRWALAWDDQGLLVKEGPRTDLSSTPITWPEGHAQVHTTRGIHGVVTSHGWRDADGRPVDRDDGIAVRRHTLDAHGNVVRVAVFDAMNRPTTLRRHHRVDQSWSPEGWLVEEAFFDTEGAPATNRAGAHRITTHYDPRGRTREVRFFDAEGDAFVNEDGFARRAFEYDAAGNRTRITTFDAEGQLVVHARHGYAERRLTYDGAGNVLTSSHYGPDGEPMRDADGIITALHRYDDHGRLVETTLVDGAGNRERGGRGCANWRYAYDALGRTRSLSCFGPLGQPDVFEGRFHTERYTWDDHDRLRLREALGVDSTPMSTAHGVSSIALDYDARGFLARLALHGPDGSERAGAQGFASMTQAWDERGLRTALRIRGAHGEAATLHGDDGPWSERRYRYDARARLTTLEQLHQGQTTRLTFRYGADDLEVERAWRDEDGHLVAGPSGWAMRTQVRDAHGHVVRGAWFDRSGAPWAAVDRASGWAASWTAEGTQVSHTWLDAEGAPVRLEAGCAGWVKRLDESGLEVERTFVDTDGQPVEVRAGYASAERTEGRRWTLRDLSGAVVARRRLTDQGPCTW